MATSNSPTFAQCFDCHLPMIRNEHGATCPGCGWTVVRYDDGRFMGWYGAKADQAELEQLSVKAAS
jgi:Zn finger protein HypA/HybF involved in hydrogenase expression